jgi:hypothetical protein
MKPRIPLALPRGQVRHNHTRVLNTPRAKNLNALSPRKPQLPERQRYRAPDPLLKAKAAPEALAGDNLTLVRRPPPSAPTPHSFTTNPASPLLRPPTLEHGTAAGSDGSTTSATAELPPAVRTERHVAARASAEDMAEMRRLRTADPALWTRGRLAKEFGCTQAFAGMVAPLKNVARKEVLAVRDEEHAGRRARWGERKRTAVEIRRKRKEFW